MRVLFVNPAAELGGSERSLLNLLAALHASTPRLEKKLVLFEDGELSHRVRALGVNTEIVPLPKALSALGESRGDGAGRAERAAALLRGAVAAPSFIARLRRAVSAFRPTILHTNGMKAHLFVAVAAPELPRVVHLRDFLGERPLSRYLLPLMRRHALFVANSKAVEKDALGIAPTLRTRVVYNGIDLETFRPRPRELGHLASLARMDAPAGDAVVIGLVATYAWWKGHRTFLDAAARLRGSVAERPLRFYVIGGSVYRTAGSEIDEATLRRSIARAGLERDVGLVPFQSDVASVYQGLDVVVHASERPEPFGRTIVEAMASGRAVVVARAGGALELFEEGRTGLGFQPGDAGDLARAVKELVRDDELRTRLATESRAHAETRFARERLAAEIVAAYDDVRVNFGRPNG